MLSIKNVSKVFGGLRAVAGMDLRVRRGTITGLIGPNRAGKSTLMKALFGLIPLMAGEVELRGQDIAGLKPSDRVRLGMGYVPQGITGDRASLIPPRD